MDDKTRDKKHGKPKGMNEKINQEGLRGLCPLESFVMKHN